jgi:hypothetical protein
MHAALARRGPNAGGVVSVPYAMQAMLTSRLPRSRGSSCSTTACGFAPYCELWRQAKKLVAMHLLGARKV